MPRSSPTARTVAAAPPLGTGRPSLQSHRERTISPLGWTGWISLQGTYQVGPSKTRGAKGKCRSVFVTKKAHPSGAANIPTTCMAVALISTDLRAHFSISLHLFTFFSKSVTENQCPPCLSVLWYLGIKVILWSVFAGDHLVVGDGHCGC